jgi:hypothetical protein
VKRRDLFKFLGIGAAALLAPELIVPKRVSYFLAPRAGWLAPPAFHMRLVEQYVINTDSMPTRYDVLYQRPYGPLQLNVTLDERDDVEARRLLGAELTKRGLIWEPDATHLLELPRAAYRAQFL